MDSLEHSLEELIEVCPEGLNKVRQFSKILEEANSSLSNVCFKGMSLTDVDRGQWTINQEV